MRFVGFVSALFVVVGCTTRDGNTASDDSSAVTSGAGGGGQAATAGTDPVAGQGAPAGTGATAGMEGSAGAVPTGGTGAIDAGGPGPAGTGGTMAMAGAGAGDGDGGGDVEDAAMGDAGGDAGSPDRGEQVPPAGTLPIEPPAAKGCITDVGPDDNLVFRNCGESIVFNVSVPTQCMTKACGLIFDVHGYSMNGSSQDQNTNLARLGREKGYVVVQPSAPNASWVGERHYPVVVEFMNLAIEVWHIEKRRVHFTGFSQGGRMTWTMRCTQSTTIASAAPIAMSSVDCGAGLPEREMPVLYTQGESDAFVGEGVGKRVADEYIEQHRMRQDEVLGSDPQYTWTRYVNDDGLLFEFIYHKYETSTTFGVGHCFPGTFTASSPYGCKQDVPFHFGEVVMDFFIAHPMEGDAP